MGKVTSVISPVIAVDRKSATPLHRQIYDAYRAAVVGRNLRAGQQIPSSRGLAAELGVSRIPVINAYSQLLAEGYFESRPGAGTFVSTSLPEHLISSEYRDQKLRENSIRDLVRHRGRPHCCRPLDPRLGCMAKGRLP